MTTPPTLASGNRRERKKQETRSALEQAALRLFGEKGYERTTVEEIAEAANVSLRTFFRYFSSKQHVLFGDGVHARVAAMRSDLRARPADEPPLVSVRAVMDGDDQNDPEQERQILVRIRLLDRQPMLRGTYLLLVDDLRQVVAEFVAERTGLSPTGHPYPQLVASAALSAWDVAMCVWSASGGELSLTELRREAFDALTAGIPPTPTG
jgi:AcrR family transcriptional regulator